MAGLDKYTCFWILSVFYILCSCIPVNTERGDFKEQIVCIKFYFKLDKTAAKMKNHQMLKEASDKQALRQDRRSDWFKHLKDGQESVDDDKHSCWLSSWATQETTVNPYNTVLEDRNECLYLCSAVIQDMAMHYTR